MRLTWIFLAICCLAAGAWAQQAVESRLVRVVLFKQGYGLMVREVTLPAGAREVTIADVPAPVHGTFWVTGSPKQLEKLTVTATTGDREATVPAVTLVELLRANIGEQVEVKTKEGWIAGSLRAMPDARREAARPPARPEERYRQSFTAPTAEANLLVMQTAQGMTALPVSSIEQVRKAAGAGELKMSFTRSTPGAVLRLHSDDQGGSLQIGYLTYGVTWAPSYRLDLETSRLLGKAVLINEAEDLDTPELSCVAGFPNLKFTNVDDPLNLQVSMAQFFAALQNPDHRSEAAVMTQVVTMNAMMPSTRMIGGQRGLPSDTPADMYLYRFNDVQVGLGDRIYLPLLDQQIACKDVYTWSPLGGSDVWHVVRLINYGKIPWTTGPLLINEGESLLGQDILNYTPPGASTEVRITKAINVYTTYQPETKGGGETVVINKVKYKKFETVGKLHVVNGTGRQIHLEISMLVTGDMVSTSVKPTSVVELPRTSVIHARQQLTWEVDIAAGKAQDISFTYKHYLR